MKWTHLYTYTNRRDVSTNTHIIYIPVSILVSLFAMYGKSVQIDAVLPA